MSDKDLVSVPQDLTLVGDQDLRDLEQQVLAEYDRLEAEEEITPELLEYATRLADGIDSIRAELAGRAARSQQAEDQERARMLEKRDTLRTRIHGKEGGNNGGGDSASPAVDPEAIAAAAARGATAALVAALGERTIGRDLAKASQRAASLADAQRYAPAITTPREKLAVVASVDIPGVATGSELPSLDAVVDAFQKRARGLPVSDSGRVDGGPRVVTVRNQFTHTVDDRTSLSQMEELLNHLTSKDKQEALVAGGGWCAPSETRYDFFNVACEDGLIDLPTIGITRGGVKWPVSPSLADTTPTGVFGGVSATLANTTNPWLWTETDDQLTVTGSTNKPCVRVPCATFSEARLECYGICLTAGNLTDDAYPEATANFLRLLLSAHTHAMNGRTIAQMVSASSTAITGGAFAVANRPAFNQVLGGFDLAATDYRARFGMCEDDVIEIVLPQWIVPMTRADLARRAGSQDVLLSVTKAQIASHFAARNARVQFVNDWQVRGSGQFGASAAMTDWPSAVNGLVYAAGTFVLGNGLTLDLGVVRDSTLNAENDHTAAWSEECHLVAKVGHESRLYTIAVDTEGDTSAVGGEGI